MKTEEEYFSLAQIKIAERFDNGERVGLKDVCIEALKLQKADIESSPIMPNEVVADELTQLLEQIPHNIPFYAYGDNQAACEMDAKLQWIYVELNAIIEKLSQREA